MMNVVVCRRARHRLFALLCWGVRTLPAERWQMLAAVPVAKSDGRIVARA